MSIDTNMAEVTRITKQIASLQAQRERARAGAGIPDIDEQVKLHRQRYKDAAAAVCAFMRDKNHDSAEVTVGDEKWTIRLAKKKYEPKVCRKHLRSVLGRLMQADEADRMYAEICPPATPEYSIRCRQKILTRSASQPPQPQPH